VSKDKLKLEELARLMDNMHSLSSVYKNYKGMSSDPCTLIYNVQTWEKSIEDIYPNFSNIDVVSKNYDNLVWDGKKFYDIKFARKWKMRQRDSMKGYFDEQRRIVTKHQKELGYATPWENNC